MRDLLPSSVFKSLQDRYDAGVENAEALFEQHAADEDSVTGALGQALASRGPMAFRAGGRRYTLTIGYKKLRGKGPGAPEKLLGADGIFQLEIVDKAGRQVRAKGLPFQAKNGWKGKDSRLLQQARNMETHVPGGIVIDYSSGGYRACSAKAAVAAGGNRRQVERFGAMKRLSQVLSGEFLECTAGIIGLFYDPQRERFDKVPFFEDPLELITTTVRRSEEIGA